jgi:selenocysteine lyase/cysteine desulfurase
VSTLLQVQADFVPVSFYKMFGYPSGLLELSLAGNDMTKLPRCLCQSLLQVPADFVPVSFYKMFGYPSGLGALLVRKQAAAALRKVYFGGGSVDWCTAEDAWHVLSALPAGQWFKR